MFYFYCSFCCYVSPRFNDISQSVAESIIAIDIALFYFVNQLPHNRVFDTIAVFIHMSTQYGFLYYPFFVIFLFSRDGRRRTLARVGVISAVITVIITELILKPIVHRARPFRILDNVFLLMPVPHDYSFPSTQTAVAFSLATLYFFLPFEKRERCAVLIFALLIGLDRIYMGHHYPFDVFGGMIIGVLVSCLTIRLCRINWKIYF
ncbi:MAG: phosphatase PAP2 family protein [wastewater metagenome]|nr:phosphatase PAP2 family protein [Candidatus Loosdrechtia aerotolerans]